MLQIIFKSFLFLPAFFCQPVQCLPCYTSGADSLRVSTLAGSGLTTPFANGVGVAATFNIPWGIAVDASGIAYVADYGNNRVRQVVLSTGAVTTLAGSGTAASTNGTGTAASFNGPLYVALDSLGNLYVTESGTHRIRKVVLATRAVTFVAGTGAAGAVNGVGSGASFNRLRGISCDSSGNAYVADLGNHRIRKIVLSSATVTTLAGSTNASAANGVGSAAGFDDPYNVVVDSSGTLLFVADFNNRAIRQIVIATQTVTTLAGSGAFGSANGVGVAAQFQYPSGLAVDSSGNLFVGEGGGNSLIRRIVIATQTVTTVAGSGAAAWIDGFGTNAAFFSPRGLAADVRGNMLAVELDNHRVRVLQPTVPCPAGVYCAPGVDAVACTPGFFCTLGGLDRAPCTAGYFCPSGSSSARQVACPAGAFHCAASAAAPVSIACAAGYDSDLH
jgi:sugar lactone lactonase YvrE